MRAFMHLQYENEITSKRACIKVIVVAEAFKPHTLPVQMKAIVLLEDRCS